MQPSMFTDIHLALFVSTFKAQRATENADFLANTTPVKNILSFAFDTGISCLLPTFTKLWQIDLLACKQGIISKLPQFLTPREMCAYLYQGILQESSEQNCL